jgi:hypothetical protein
MRQFGSSGFRLWNLGADAKTLYTAFCLLTFLGVVSSALYYRELVGAGTSGIRRYYAGEDDQSVAAPEAPPSPSQQPTQPPAGGPTIEVPPEAQEAHRSIVVAVSYRKLLEVTHFHLFTMPVVLLIVGHLFLATGLSERAKRVWLIAGVVSVGLHLATPWLVRAVAGLAPLHALSGIALTVTMAVLTLYPVGAMWRRPDAVIDRRVGPDGGAAGPRSAG